LNINPLTVRKVQSQYLPSLVNEFSIDNYQSESDVIKFFESFLDRYSLTKEETLILLTTFQYWLKQC
jgi:hypothetical protein